MNSTVRRYMIIAFILIALGVTGISYVIYGIANPTTKAKYVIVVAKFSDVNKYVVVRQYYGVHITIKVNDKTFNHIHVGDSILYAGN